MSAADRREALAGALPTAGQDRAASRLWELDLVGRVWRFFTSVRLALILILIIAAAVMAGTLLDQAPASVFGDSAAYQQWLDLARGKYGTTWANIFNFLQLFNVFHSWWFRVLVALLTANIIVCSINRWKGIWTTAFRTRVRMGDAFFQHSRFNATMVAPMSLDTAAERVKRALSRARYRVQTQADAGSVAIYADRYRLSKFGTFFSHLSIVMILAGTIVGSLWGFSDGQFIVAEGTTRDVGHGTGLSVRLEHFTDEYFLEGPPKDYRSELVIYNNGVEVKQGETHVNSPLSYHGVVFHQAFFGQTAVMQVKDASGAELWNAPVPLAWQSVNGNRPLGSFTLAGKNMAVYVIGPQQNGTNDPLIPAGEMRVEVYTQTTDTLVKADTLTQGTPKELGGLTFTFLREGRFTGLKITKDPGANLIWIAAALMIVGLVALFYFPHRRLWAICKERPDGSAEVRIATTSQRDLAQESHFEQLRERVGMALGIPQADKPAEGGKDV